MGPERLGQLVDEHAAGLVLYARQWCAAAPEDVVQEAFVKLAGLPREPDSVAAWLYRVVRNGAVSAARREQRRRRHESQAARPLAWFLPGAEPDGPDPQAVAEALEELPPDLREPVVAHLWGGLTFAQIGPLMGASASTAHRRYLEGLQALRERLGVTCPDDTKTSPRPR